MMTQTEELAKKISMDAIEIILDHLNDSTWHEEFGEAYEDLCDYKEDMIYDMQHAIVRGLRDFFKTL